MPSRLAIAALALTGAAGGAAAIAALPAHRPRPAAVPVSRTVVFGHSVQARALVARERGNPAAARRILVVGCIHGDECAGRAVVRRLAAMPARRDIDLWLVDEANPDGARLRRRQNARGVDLNRNFPFRWRRLDRRGGLYWSGPGPLSEPESRALQSLILRLRPDVTVWYHQHMRLVDLSGGDPAGRTAGCAARPRSWSSFPPGTCRHRRSRGMPRRCSPSPRRRHHPAWRS